MTDTILGVLDTDREFVAYEYTTVNAPRALAPLYRDSYCSFGWTVEATRSALRES